MILFALVLCFCHASDLSKNRLKTVKSLLTTTVDSSGAFMLLNNNEMIGAYSKKGVVRGKCHRLNAQEEVNGWSSGEETEVVVVIPDNILNAKNLELFGSKKVVGVVAYKSEGNITSQDKQTSFNPDGDNSAWKLWDFPIFYTTASVDYFASEGSHLQIEAAMNSDVNSETCLRRGMCKPIGGQTLYGKLDNTTRSKKILLTAQLDGVSLFRETTPANEQVLSGEVTLLSVMQTLKPLMKKSNISVEFALFEDETFGHMGSRLFSSTNDSYDAIYNFGHLGLTEGKVYVYTQHDIPTVERLEKVTLTPPESPLDSFKNGVKYHFADHLEVYKGKVGTHRDVIEKIEELCDNVKTISRVLMETLFETNYETFEKDNTVEYNCSIFDELYSCFAEDMTCEYFNETIGVIKGNGNSYSSIYGDERITARSKALSDYLKYIVTLNHCEGDCEVNNGTVQYLPTHGSDIDTDKNQIRGNSGDAWTESDWKTLRLSFYKTRKLSDIIMCVVGVVTTMAFITASFVLLFKGKYFE
ncbi:hypothetical protein EIN_064870 [Entamoeba invadens IP1]|uniref:Nicastrin n=1 Tax=Entamoeba invadens IP1 TaxID=370355 RepID=A0A0A1TV88_ENTIV|nr:hypothetical protein EIN_064870 [Entamoeba invadens IP1]ELP84252.1 hypothetical protein EIN_064870 [Entamoeba invadens IP1]|eukprot:XP_004183598.1 hypothetical protein EIN_064870 [Entamoeba invadens IP1]